MNTRSPLLRRRGVSAGHRSTPPITGSMLAHRGDHVGDHAALAHRGDRLQIRERRIPVVHPIGAGAAVADHVHAELAARRFDGDVDLARRNPDAFGDQFEVVDQRLHRAAHDLRDVLRASCPCRPGPPSGRPARRSCGPRPWSGRARNLSRHCSTIFTDSHISLTRMM